MKLPSLCKQKRASGDLAYVRLNGTKIYCGPWGSQEASEKYERFIAEWLTTKQVASIARKDTITIRVLVAAFLDHAETYYVKNGRQTTSFERFKRVAKPLLENYGSLPVDDFGPSALDVLRSKLIESRKVQKPNPFKKPEPLSRNYVNQYIGFVRQIFKWGVGKEMVKPETHYALCQLAGIKKGRSRAKELPKVKPVDDEEVEKTLPFLPSPVAAMVRLQRLTGMRPGEVRQMRACDIDCSGNVWNYIPWEHKTEHHDLPRLVCLGPKCQAILTPYLMDRENKPENGFSVHRKPLLKCDSNEKLQEKQNPVKQSPAEKRKTLKGLQKTFMTKEPIAVYRKSRPKSRCSALVSEPVTSYRSHSDPGHGRGGSRPGHGQPQKHPD